MTELSEGHTDQSKRTRIAAIRRLLRGIDAETEKAQMLIDSGQWPADLMGKVIYGGRDNRCQLEKVLGALEPELASRSSRLRRRRDSRQMLARNGTATE